MRIANTAAAITVALTSGAYAGGLERTDQSMSVLFEKGRYLEFGGFVGFPSVSGVGSSKSPTPGKESGDLASTFANFRAAYKDDINERISYAFIFDQPYGADVKYPTSSFFASNASASLSTYALTGVVQYNLPESMRLFGGGFSVYGGPKLQYTDAEADIPFLNKYKVTADGAFGYGFLAGVAYEKPELGIRVSLTYSSVINTDLSTTESFRGAPGVSTTTSVDTPESLYLEFQTGINPKTLLYGSVRWVPWSEFKVSPPLYTGATGSPLAYFVDDRFTYRLGLGRKLTDTLSIFGELGYEQHTGSPTTNLTPVDGFMSYSAGLTKQFGRAKFTLAGRYADVGDADSQLGKVVPAGEYSGNSLWAVGMRVGFDLN